MATLTNLAAQRMLEGFLARIQTGGGTAYLRVVDVFASPDVTIMEFDLSTTEFTISNNIMYTSNALEATAVASALAKNCSMYLVARDGTNLAVRNAAHDVPGFNFNITDFQIGGGIGYFTSGYSYVMNDWTIGIDLV